MRSVNLRSMVWLICGLIVPAAIAIDSVAAPPTPKTDQTGVTVSATPSTIKVGATSSLSSSGGQSSGSVTYGFSSGGNSGNVCAISGSTLTGNKVGTCSVVATKAGDSTYNAKTSDPVTVTVEAKSNQTGFTASASPSTIKIGSTSTLSTSGGQSGGAVSYAFASGGNSGNICSLSGSTVTGDKAGTCTITATKAGDASYNDATYDVTVTVEAKSNQTGFTASASPSTIKIGSTSTLSTSGGQSGGAVSYAFASGGNSGNICSLSGSTVTGDKAGTCTITATKAGDASYNDATYDVTVTVEAKSNQTGFTASASPSTIKIGSTSTLSTSGGQSGGAVSYAFASGGNSGNICSLSGSTVTGDKAGTCTITATKAGDASYNDATYDVTVTVEAKSNQTGFTASASPSTIKIGSTSTLSTSGGQSGGAVSYAFASGGNSGNICSLSGSTVTGDKAGTCTITATKAGDASYNDATYDVTVTVEAKSNQTGFTASASPSTIKIGSTSTLSTSGGQSGGAVSYAFASGGNSGNICSLSGSTVTGDKAGTCTITATKAGDASYNDATYDVTVTVEAKSNQTGFTASASPSTIKIGSTSTLSTSGGQSGGAVSYAFASGGNSGNICSLSGSTVTGDKAGTCTITATKAGDASYNDATYDVTVTVEAKSNQTGFTASASPSTIKIGSTSTLSTSGGQSGGAVSYAFASGGNSGNICSLSGSTVTGDKAGTCTITATKAGDASYNDATYDVTVTVEAKSNQTGFTASASPSTIKIGSTSTLSTSGGQSGGAVSYAFASGGNSGNICSLSGSTVTGDKAGTCTITATKAGDASYFATTSDVTITVNATSQIDPTLKSSVRQSVYSQFSAAHRMASNHIGAVFDRTNQLRLSNVPNVMNSLTFANAEDRDMTEGVAGNYALSVPDPYDAMRMSATSYLYSDKLLTSSNAFTQQPHNSNGIASDSNIWTSGRIISGIDKSSPSNDRSSLLAVSLTLGVDTAFSTEFRGGAALSFSTDRTDIGASGGYNKGLGLVGSFYGSYQIASQTYVDAVLGLGTMTLRSLRVDEEEDALLTGERDARTVFGSIGLTHVLEAEMSRIVPFIRYDISKADLDGYAENGDPYYAIAYEDAQSLSQGVTIGMVASHDIERDWGVLSPRVRAEYRRAISGSSSQLMHYASDVDGSFYRLPVDATRRDTVTGAFGFDFLIGPSTAFIEYAVQYEYPTGYSAGILKGSFTSAF